MKYLLTILMFCMTISLSSYGHANKMGAAVGVPLPHNLSLSDQTGAVQNFDTLSGDKGLILFFVRSADWCPYCQIQILDLNKRSAEFTEMGYNVATISYDDVEKLERFSSRYKVSFPMLSDKTPAL